jgi:hypothetical protein
MVFSLTNSLMQFITKEMRNITIRYTNEKGNELKAAGKQADWRDIDDCELKAFLGLLLLYGVQKGVG